MRHQKQNNCEIRRSCFDPLLIPSFVHLLVEHPLRNWSSFVEQVNTFTICYLLCDLFSNFSTHFSSSACLLSSRAYINLLTYFEHYEITVCNVYVCRTSNNIRRLDRFHMCTSVLMVITFFQCAESIIYLVW